MNFFKKNLVFSVYSFNVEIRNISRILSLKLVDIFGSMERASFGLLSNSTCANKLRMLPGFQMHADIMEEYKMNKKVSIPSIKFRIIIDGSWIAPEPYMRDIGALLKYYLFHTSSGFRDLGLEIKYDGIPWNKPELVESTINLLTWFQGVERLINGETEVDIWAWEESDCIMMREGDIITISDLSADEKAYCPEVSFYTKDFIKEMYREGQVTIKFLEKLMSRIQEISKQLTSDNIPSVIDSWMNENKKCDINDINELRRQWEEIYEIFMDKETINKMKASIEAIRIEIEKK